MTTSELPARPSLESLRKQAKKLARDIAAGDAVAIDRRIDMTIRDYRWGGTAEGWASVAAKDEKMAQ